MVEFTSPQEGFQAEGHYPNVDNLVLELYRLLAMFLSSEKFATLYRPFPEERLEPIARIQSVEEDELTRLLLTLAISARVIDDRDGQVLDKYGSSCGWLDKRTANSNPEELSLREACNKIIHAKRIRVDQDERDGVRYFTPTIYLYDQKDGQSGWKAALDVIEFAKIYYLLICHL